jgi:hypothetical protein
MSLQLAAQHLSHQGRGGDSTLVHMSPREVKSLNDLAMAHGGQLSINPQTGLPEAGFLSSILPMVAGAALTASGVGAPMAALMVGGGMTLMTGSLEKGLMAGLGAYGGANLGESLLASGADPAAAGLSQANIEPYLSGPGAAGAEMSQAAAQATQTAQAAQTAEQAVASQQAAEQAARAQALASQAAPVAPAPVIDPAEIAPIEPVSSHYSVMQNNSPAFQANVPPPMSFMDKIKTMGGNISPSNLLKFAKEDPMSAASGLASLYSPKEKKKEEKDNADMGQRYGFSANPTSGQSGQNSTTTPFPTPDIYGREQRYSAPSYTKLTPEQAKSMYGFADGGTAQANTPQPATQPIPMPQFTNAGKQPSSETPALQAFNQMQAQRAVQAQTPQYASTPATGGAPAANAPTPTTVEELYGTYLGRTPEKGGLDFWNKHFGPSVDASEVERFKHATIPELAANRKLAEQTGGPLAHEFNQYLRQTVGEPNQPQAPTAPTTTDSSSELIYDPVKQTYIKNPNFVDAAAAAAVVEPEPFVYTGAGSGDWRNGGNPYPKNVWATGTNKAAGGLMDAYAAGGMTKADRMAAASSYIGGNTSYPQAHSLTNRFSTPTQIPISEDVVSRNGTRINLSTGEERLASGGISDAGYNLGGYSDGGQLLRGPGDGVSDSIPAVIGKKQPARLADGEFVVPARIVSELGNGSTEAGARKLYAMMDRIQSARGKTVGKGKVAKNSRADRLLPA